MFVTGVRELMYAHCDPVGTVSRHACLQNRLSHQFRTLAKEETTLSTHIFVGGIDYSVVKNAIWYHDVEVFLSDNGEGSNNSHDPSHSPPMPPARGSLAWPQRTRVEHTSGGSYSQVPLPWLHRRR